MSPKYSEFRGTAGRRLPAATCTKLAGGGPPGLASGLHGGPVQVNGRVDSLQAYSDGGSATITLSAPPAAVTINSDGGPATLRVPGGPYALLADSDGGPEMVYIATSPSAQRSITVTSGGGSLQISP